MTRYEFINKLKSALEQTCHNTLVVAGGVAANSHLRKALEDLANKNGVNLSIPSRKYCGDNAAMIGCQAYYDYLAGRRADESLNAVATLSLDDISVKD